MRLDAGHLGHDGRREVAHDDEEGDTRAHEESRHAQLHGQLAREPEGVERQQLVVPASRVRRSPDQQPARGPHHQAGQRQQQRAQDQAALRIETDCYTDTTTTLPNNAEVNTFLKQKGMARMLTPMMELASVTTKRSAMMTSAAPRYDVRADSQPSRIGRESNTLHVQRRLRELC